MLQVCFKAASVGFSRLLPLKEDAFDIVLIKDIQSTKSSVKVSDVSYTNSSMDSQKKVRLFMFGQHGSQVKCSNVQFTALWIRRWTRSCLKVPNSHGKVFQGTIMYKSYVMNRLGQD
ncbi:hypothetical protein AVEN_186104-1 [Araneus ventricosus]|uniref:Uncharacterized protein n=1 Tax=Araneus ventricosus TaxID=182803 RepID=A0A4Y2VB99_ARAVE|nr:hypothetical protein AVEN_186104-1 [Araneus ventricosus]